MPEEKILTLHPDPSKAGVNILRRRYELMKETILGILSRNGAVSFRDLTEEAGKELTGVLDGNIPWYVVVVKQDLEARGVIQQVPGKKPQQLRLVEPNA